MRCYARTTLTWLLLISAVRSSHAANDSNYLQLLNGVDFFYGGTYSPPNQPPNVTNGFFRCVPSEVLHSPTKVIDSADPQFGRYATKVNSLHFTSCASTGAVSTWPTIALSSGDSDCRAVVGGGLNFGIMSSTPLGGNQAGWFMVGPTAGTQVNLLALVFNTTFPGPHIAGPTGATVYAVDLSLDPLVGASAIRVPEDQSLTFWMSTKKASPPAAHQYMTGSENESSICSSLSFFVSGVASLGTGVVGAVFASPSQREWGMFIGTLDATLNLASNTDPAPASLGLSNPVLPGAGALTLSLTNTLPVPLEISFFTNDATNIFGGSGKLVFCNLMAVNSLLAPNCGPWSPGYTPLPTGGPGGPVFSTAIPQQPRVVGKLDILAFALLSNPLWLIATTHDVVPGGTIEPRFLGSTTLIGGSTGNTGGSSIEVRGRPGFVGMQLFFSEVNLNPSHTGLAAAANSGHSNTNGFATTFFP